MLAALSLLRRQLACIDHSLHQRLIFRHLLCDAIHDDVGTTVAHLREVHHSADDESDRRGGAHSMMCAILLRVVVNRLIRGEHCLRQRIGNDDCALERSLCSALAKLVEYDLRGERARDFT